MGWKAGLQKGSFRGVPFFTESSDGGPLGRRIALHEFPLRDKPYAEDLGAKARQWPLEIYVVGPEYMAARDKLAEALNAPGAGTLVHPYLGTKQVVVIEAQGPRESTSEGGMARFSVTFAEAGENSHPATSIDTAAMVGQRADQAITVVEEGFAEHFSVSGVVGFVSEAAEGVASMALDTISSLAGMMPTVPSGVSAFVADALKAGSSVASLIRSPSLFAGRIASLISSLAGLPLQPKAALAAYKMLWPWGSDATSSSAGSYPMAGATPLPVVPRTTPSRIIQANNQDAVVALVRQLAVVESARTAASLSYGAEGDIVSAQEATELREAITEQIDDILLTADDATFVAFTDLRAAVVQDFTTRGVDLANLTEYTPAATTSSLALAHRLYGDATRADELVGRNNIRHPGFIPGGQSIEVLTNG